MTRLVLAATLLLLAGCPSDAQPITGLDVTASVNAWVRKADADWADFAAADVLRLNGLTPEKILDLVPSKAESVCRILAHLDDPGVRTLFLDLLDHPDSYSGFYRGFIVDAAVIGWTRARLAGKIPDTKPLEARIRAQLRTTKDWRWFSPLADATEALGAKALLPDLRAALERLGESARDARPHLILRTVEAHRILGDPGAVDIARALGIEPNYLHRHDPGNHPLMIPFVVSGWNDWPGGKVPPGLEEKPSAVRFLIRHGRGNEPMYLLRFIQPPMSKTRPRWHAEERNILQQLSELQSLYAIPLPSLMNELGEPDPYQTWGPRITEWWETKAHQLRWNPEEWRYTP